MACDMIAYAFQSSSSVRSVLSKLLSGSTGGQRRSINTSCKLRHLYQWLRQSARDGIAATEVSNIGAEGAHRGRQPFERGKSGSNTSFTARSSSRKRAQCQGWAQKGQGQEGKWQQQPGCQLECNAEVSSEQHMLLSLFKLTPGIGQR